MFVNILIVVILIGYLVYKWLTKEYQHFENFNVPYVKPKILLGSFYGFLLGKESMREEFLRACNKFKNQKAFGIFEGRNPILVINDLELLKKITIKDFDYFKNHKGFGDPEDDPLFGNSLFAMKDEKWHDMRTTLSPAFTGSKLRLMFQLILDICNNGIQHLEKRIKNECKDGCGLELDMKNFFSLFTNDAIASTAFGLETNSLENPDNEFYKVGLKMTNFSKLQMVKFMLFNIFRWLFRFLGIKLTDQQMGAYFTKTVIGAINYRKEHNIVRQDMINMLIEAQSNPEKSHNRQWTDIELVAQCFIFFFAGFESVSTTLCFAAQELIENPDVQEKLREEIDSVNENLNGQPITYEIIQKMKYMDAFISEVLRKWPPFIAVDRVCTKIYSINEDDLRIDIRPGDLIWLPFVGLHMNDNNFENPEKFDPERFSVENKVLIKPMSYAPFGYGPRLCIGQRLALVEMKAILFYILINFKLEVGKKSQIPIKLAATTFPTTAKDGFWLKMVPRK